MASNRHASDGSFGGDSSVDCAVATSIDAADKNVSFSSSTTRKLSKYEKKLFYSTKKDELRASAPLELLEELGISQQLNGEDDQQVVGATADDEPYESWRRLLKDAYRSNGADQAVRDELCTAILLQIFGNDTNNVWDNLLELYETAFDVSSNRRDTLAMHIVWCFDQFMQKIDVKLRREVCEQLTRALKEDLLDAVTRYHGLHLRFISGYFDSTNEDDHDMLVTKLVELHRKKKWIVAVGFAHHFELHGDVRQVTDFLVPALACDGENIVFDYLEASPHALHLLLPALDQLMSLTDDGYEYFISELRREQIITAPPEKFSRKVVEKLILKIVSRFGLSWNEVPNFVDDRVCSSFAYYCALYYLEQTISLLSFVEILMHKISHVPHLSHYLFRILLNKRSHGGLEMALYLARKLKIPLDQQPQWMRRQHTDTTMMDKVKCLQEDIDRAREESENGSKYADRVEIAYVFRDGRSTTRQARIVTVRQQDQMEEMIEHLARHAVIAIDAEFRTIDIDPRQSLALLQVAVSDCVFLVDPLSLELEPSDWENFLEQLLCRSGQIKIGFAITNDLQAMRNTFVQAEQIQCVQTNVICLARLVNHLLSAEPGLIDLPRHCITNPDGTAKIARTFKMGELARAVLGLDVDKHEQIGSWSIRPLRYSQQQYAAVDAFCLLGIYDELKRLTSCDWNDALSASEIHVTSARLFNTDDL